MVEPVHSIAVHERHPNTSCILHPSTADMYPPSIEQRGNLQPRPRVGSTRLLISLQGQGPWPLALAVLQAAELRNRCGGYYWACVSSCWVGLKLSNSMQL